MVEKAELILKLTNAMGAATKECSSKPKPVPEAFKVGVKWALTEVKNHKIDASNVDWFFETLEAMNVV